MKLGEKLKAIRAAEGLSQNEFCEVIDLSINTLRKYETGGYEPGGSALVKIAQHPRFQKYTLWLMSDITAPEAGQIAPVIKEEKKTG
ncbi:helix-turn-helix domain-containing protein [Escherichia coli]|nr:helix-turn-helix transcriptional regulator [Escherichia coli]